MTMTKLFVHFARIFWQSDNEGTYPHASLSLKLSIFNLYAVSYTLLDLDFGHKQIHRNRRSNPCSVGGLNKNGFIVTRSANQFECFEKVSMKYFIVNLKEEESLQNRFKK